MQDHTPPPVEMSTKYATTVAEVTDAFAFVMAHLDSVGPDPEVTIRPVWRCNHDAGTECGSIREFEVAVGGTVDQPAYESEEAKRS